MKLQKTLSGSCHCKAIEFEVEMPNGLIDPRRCNCSFCRRRGTIVAVVPKEGFHLLRGADKLSLYKFNTLTATHFFCSICGIHTHNISRTHPDKIRFNIACLPDIDPFGIGDVPVSDGINHVADKVKQRL